MGSPDDEPDHQADEGPMHQVNIKRFALGRYEVTFAEYDAFALATGRKLPDDRGSGRDKRPVINVPWDDAQAYAQWLSERTGNRYRLPTEAEWEYAARAKTTNARFWGDNPADACQYANVDDESHKCTDGYKATAPVGTFKPNDFGAYDMLGNVLEWVQDCWHGNYKDAPTDGAAWREQQGGDCNGRVFRGGSWLDGPEDVRSAYRGGGARRATGTTALVFVLPRTFDPLHFMLLPFLARPGMAAPARIAFGYAAKKPLTHPTFLRHKSKQGGMHGSRRSANMKGRTP